MDDRYGANLFLCVCREAFGDLGAIGAVPPVALDPIDLQAESLGDAAPEVRELPGLGHQHGVAGG